MLSSQDGTFFLKNDKCLVGNSLIGRILILRPFRDRSRKGDHMYHSHTEQVLSHDFTATLVSQNNKMAAMSVSQTRPMGVELFSYANDFFRSNKFAYWSRGWKRSIRHLHICHNAPHLHPPPPPPTHTHTQIMHNLSFLLGITAVPREIKNNPFKKTFLGGGEGGGGAN